MTPAGVVTTFAGSLGAIGRSDGTGSSATFNYPNGLAFDSGGNLFVADVGNNSIRRITPAGVVTTVAGTTSLTLADGIGTDAGFYSPYALMFDMGGNLWVISGGSRERLRYGTPVVAPTITTQPGNQTACPTCSFYSKFTVAATGSPTGYRWQESKDQGTTWTDVTNSTGSQVYGTPYYLGQGSGRLQLVAAKAMNGYQYRCVAYNAAGWDTSAKATLTASSPTRFRSR